MSELLKRYLDTPPNKWRYLAPFGTVHIWIYRARLLRCRYLNQHEWHTNDGGRESCRHCGLDRRHWAAEALVQPLFEYRLIVERRLGGGESRVAREENAITPVEADKTARYWRDKAERGDSSTRGHLERREVTFWVHYLPDDE